MRLILSSLVGSLGRMWKGIACCGGIAAAAAENLPWRRQISAYLVSNHLVCNSTASYSSSTSRKSSSVHNYYIRKRRKWPIRPYQHLWVESFGSQLAKQFFKQSIRKSKTSLLSDLISSFAAYEIEPSTKSYDFLFKVLIQKGPWNWEDQIQQILDHIEKVESFETPECIFMDLIKFYGDNDLLNDALDLFFRIPKFRCKPSVEVLNTLLSVLCRNQSGLEIVPQLLIKSKIEMNVRIEGSSYGILIRALCKMGKLSDALTLLNHMVEEGFDVDQKVCSLMLSTMCRHVDCDGDEILGFLEDLRRLGFEPRKEDFHAVIWLLVRKGNGLDALELLKQMKKNGVKADIMCYSLVVDGLVHDRNFSSADKVFDELLVIGLVPDIHTYNAFIKGLCMQKKVEGGIQMLGSMANLGCPPELNTYNTILRALCEAGEMDRMKEMVNDIKQKGLKLNSHTYEIMIDVCISESDVHGACSLLNEMLEKGTIPQPTALDKIICWLCKNGLFLKAVELLEEMAGKDIAPGVRTWQALIQGNDLLFNFEKITPGQLSLRYLC